MKYYGYFDNQELMDKHGKLSKEIIPEKYNWEKILDDLNNIINNASNELIKTRMIYDKYKKGGRADYYRVEWFDETKTYEYGIGDIDLFRKQYIRWREKL